MPYITLVFLAAAAALTAAELNITLNADGSGFVATGLQDSMERVIDGRAARSGQFPWQANILVQREQGQWNFVSGALISRSWVVTLASAVRGSRETRILLGSTGFSQGRQTFSTRVLEHPQYRRNRNRLFNIAAICLQDPIEPRGSIRPIELVPANMINQRFYGQRAVISGFGSAGEFNVYFLVEALLMKFCYIFADQARPFSTLQWAELRVTSPEACRQRFPRAADSLFFCAVSEQPAGSRPGFGDIGAPLVWRHNKETYLIGLTARGTPRTAQLDGLAGFFNIALHSNWLRKLVKP